MQPPALLQGRLQNDPCKEYREIVLSLEKAASNQVDTIMADPQSLSEPFIAYEVARTLPAGVH